jgi:hypothetical protein
MSRSQTIPLACRRLATLLSALAVLAVGPSLRACPVPVYQYSLEHWETDPYVVVVRGGENLSELQLAALGLLEAAARGNEGHTPANLELRREPAHEGDTAARVELFYPKSTGIRAMVWSGDLNPENAAAIVDSPLRAELAKALAGRTSAVWVLLGSGDRAADREAENTLRRELDLAAKSIVVPESADWGGEKVAIDHKVNFKILRIGREDPAERIFAEMLLASEPDLKSDFADQPMVFPVYGRGLALYALVGKGINAATIRSATEFLTGPCSCQIKSGNPGTDLLLSMDWAKEVEAKTPATVGGTTGTGGFLQKLDEAGAAKEGKP